MSEISINILPCQLQRLPSTSYFVAPSLDNQFLFNFSILLWTIPLIFVNLPPHTSASQFSLPVYVHFFSIDLNHQSKMFALVSFRRKRNSCRLPPLFPAEFTVTASSAIVQYSLVPPNRNRKYIVLVDLIR